MELLRSRGSAPSSSAQRMFSVAGSQASQEASPDKGAGVGLADSPRGAGPREMPTSRQSRRCRGQPARRMPWQRP
eukprot:9067623-Alexandrium_andersonii.AAC.1